jgi:L-iditol 2-dehydrogenase
MNAALRTTMRAAVLYGREDLRIESIPIPVPERGEIVVRIEAALTCGTDLKVYRRGYHARMGTPPFPFGHELAGVVAAVGEGVTDFLPGDRVVALNSAPCDECYFCRRGQQNLCEDLLFNNGAYAEYLRIPARIVAKNTLHVPDEISLESAALTEPLACVVLGVEQSGITASDSVAIIGAGPIGLLFIHTAALLGAEVIAVVKHDAQVAAARHFGARHVVQITETGDPIDAVRALTPLQRGPDVVVEAVAQPVTWQWAVDMVRNGGIVNFFGGPPSGTLVQLDTTHLHYNSITLKASFHHTPASVRSAFALITGGRFQAADFLTGHAPLEGLQPALERLMQRSNEIKTVITPGKL